MSSATIPDTARINNGELISAEQFLEKELGNAESAVASSPQAPIVIEARMAASGFTPAHESVAAPHIHIEPARDPRSKVLPRLLAMADGYLKSGAIRQALEMYFDLYTQYEDTPEAALAEDRILEVARIHELNGEMHLARAIYERLV